MITTGYEDIFISEDDFLFMIINDREQRQRTPIMHTDIAKQKRVATHANKWTIIWKKYYSNSFDKIIYVENCCSGSWAVFMLSKIELTPFNDWRKILLLEVVVLRFCSKMNRFISNYGIPFFAINEYWIKNTAPEYSWIYLTCIDNWFQYFTRCSKCNQVENQ